MNPIVWEIHKFSLGTDESLSYKGSDYLCSSFRFKGMTFGWVSVPSQIKINCKTRGI